MKVFCFLRSFFDAVAMLPEGFVSRTAVRGGLSEVLGVPIKHRWCIFILRLRVRSFFECFLTQGVPQMKVF